MGDLFSSKQETSQSQATRIPANYQNLMNRTLGFANEGLDTPFQDYEAPRIADLSANEQAGTAMAGQNAGMYQPLIDMAMVNNAGMQAQGGVPTQNDLDSFMNPYINSVLGNSLARLNEQSDTNMTNIGSQAAMSGAFGSSRHGVLEGANLSELLRSTGTLTANTYSDAFDKGMGNFFTSQNLRRGTIQDALGIAQGGSAYNTQDVNNLMNTGLTGRTAEQANLDFAYSEFMREQQDPYIKANFASSVLSQFPTGLFSKTGESTSTSTPSPMSTAVGIGTAAAGLMTGNPAALAGIGAGASALGKGGAGGGAGPTAQSLFDSGQFAKGGKVKHKDPFSYAGGGQIPKFAFGGSLNRFISPAYRMATYKGPTTTPGAASGDGAYGSGVDQYGNDIPDITTGGDPMSPAEILLDPGGIFSSLFASKPAPVFQEPNKILYGDRGYQSSNPLPPMDWDAFYQRHNMGQYRRPDPTVSNIPLPNQNYPNLNNPSSRPNLSGFMQMLQAKLGNNNPMGVPSAPQPTPVDPALPKPQGHSRGGHVLLAFDEGGVVPGPDGLPILRADPGPYKASPASPIDQSTGKAFRQYQILPDYYRDPIASDVPVNTPPVSRDEGLLGLIGSLSLHDRERSALQERIDPAQRQRVLQFLNSTQEWLKSRESSRQKLKSNVQAHARGRLVKKFAQGGGVSFTPPDDQGADPGYSYEPEIKKFEKGMFNIESNGGDPYIVNPDSQAFGSFQFLPSTWNTYASKLNHKPGFNGKLPLIQRSDLKKIEGISDPEARRQALEGYLPSPDLQRKVYYGGYLPDSVSVLAKAGHAPTARNLYMAHILGQDRAARVIGAIDSNPDKSMKDILTNNGVSKQSAARIVDTNPGMLGGKASEFSNKVRGHFTDPDALLSEPMVSTYASRLLNTETGFPGNSPTVDTAQGSKGWFDELTDDELRRLMAKTPYDPKDASFRDDIREAQPLVTYGGGKNTLEAGTGDTRDSRKRLPAKGKGVIDALDLVADPQVRQSYLSSIGVPDVTRGDLVPLPGGGFTPGGAKIFAPGSMTKTPLPGYNKGGRVKKMAGGGPTNYNLSTLLGLNSEATQQAPETPVWNDKPMLERGMNDSSIWSDQPYDPMSQRVRDMLGIPTNYVSNTVHIPLNQKPQGAQSQFSANDYGLLGEPPRGNPSDEYFQGAEDQTQATGDNLIGGLQSAIDTGGTEGAVSGQLDSAMDARDQALHDRLSALLDKQLSTYESDQNPEKKPTFGLFKNINEPLLKFGLAILANSDYPNNFGAAIGKAGLSVMGDQEQEILQGIERKNAQVKSLLNAQYMQAMVQNMDPRVKERMQQRQMTQNYAKIMLQERLKALNAQENDERDSTRARDMKVIEHLSRLSENPFDPRSSGANKALEDTYGFPSLDSGTPDSEIDLGN